MMENKCKRFLSLLLAFVMILGMFPAGYAHVHAAEAGLTPVAPEAGKTYVICFKADNGDYYAMTSTYANKNNHGTLLTEKVTGTYNEAIGWNLVAADDNGGYYLNAADDGHGLSLNGTISNDAFADANHPAEIMTLEPSGDGYLIKNPSNRYVNALGAVAGNGSWGACGNWESGTTAYFFEIPEISINLTEGETYEVSGVAEAPNVTDNEVIDVESDFVQGTVKNHKLATTIEDGVYVIVNTRSNKWLLNTPVDGAKKLQNVAGEPNLGDNAYLWTVTAVEGEADTYYLGNNGKYLNLPGHEQAELVNDENATVRITTSPLYAYAWEIFDTNTYMNDLSSNVGSYTGQNDGGSQWVFYKVSDVPACTYAGVEELPSDATITSGNEYLLVNIRNGNKTLLNKQNPGANACLYLNGTANAPSNNAVWTITEHEGSYYIQDQNGKYLTFSSSAATVTTDSTPVSIGWQGFGSLGEAWAITRTVNGRKEYMSNPGGGNTNSGGGWHEENDGGSRWKIYTTSTTPVGTYDVTVTGKGVGEATVVIGMAIYTFHVSANHVHNFVGNVTTPANCVDEGVKTFTCECGEGTYTEVIPVDSKNHKTTEIRPEVKPTLTKEGKTEEVYCTACNTSVSGGETIPQLTMKNAKILDGGEVLALSDCEYVLGGTEGAYSLCHGGTYYVNIRANGVNCNQTTTASAYLNLDWDDSDGDAVSIWQNTDRLGYLYIHYADAVPKWNANGSYAANNCDMYLLYADANSTNADIPGYTIADAEYVADHIEEGESYLIAAKNTHGNWFVMVPSVTGNAVGDYIAQVVTDAVTHTHEYTVENVTKDPTCAETGLKDLKCSCGHFHAAEHKNVEIPATGEHTYTYDCDTNCKVCGQKTRPEATHVSDAAYDCVAGKCQYCETPMEAAASHTPAEDDGDCTTAIACSVCGQEATAAKSHAWAEKGTYTEPTFEADGFTTYNCTNSGCTKTNVVTHEGTKKVAVAELNGEKYETLAAALSDAQSGDTVKLLADCEFESAVPEGATLDLNSHKLIFNDIENLLGAGRISLNGGAIVVKQGEDEIEMFGPNALIVKTNDGVLYLPDTGITMIGGTFNFDWPIARMTVAGTAKLVVENSDTTNIYLTLDSTTASIEGPEGMNVTTDVENHEVVYENGTYTLVEKAPVVNYVAKIGEQGYETLADAIAVAQAGDTITFLADITEDVTVNKAVTIDGAGKTYTGQMTLKADTTIKNVNFDGKGYNGYAVETRGADYLTIEDCTAVNYGYGFVQLASGTVLTTVKNVTVSNMNYGVKIDYSNAVVLENVDITVGVAAVLNSNYGEKTITIKDSDLNILGTWTRNPSTQTTYTFEGENTIDQFVTDATIDNFKLAAGATLTAPQDITVTTDVENHEVVYENGTYKLVEKKVAVAKIGEQGYETLAAAIAAAKAGDTITFLADITENVTIDKSVTIDGAGKTYTGTMTGNKGLTITIENVNFVNGGFEKPKAQKSTTGTYTIKNCTFVDDGNFNYPVRIYGANKLVVENCTVSGYKYSFLYVVSGTNTVSVKNVTVENCPTYAVYFASGVNDATFENLTVKNSDNGFVINNTANRSFTIKDCKMENVGTAINYSSGTKAITCTAQGNNDFGTAVLSEYAKVVLTENATLTAPEGLNVTTNAGDGYKVIYEEGVYKVVYAPAAMIGEQGYATLGEAFAAAQDGDTIVVMKDIDLAKETPVLLDGSYNTYFKVEGKNVTVNMNGMTISGAYTDSGKMLVGVFSTDNGGHLTVTGNGAVNVTATAKVYSLFANYEPGCSITIEDGTYTLDKAHDSLLYSGCNTAENEGITVNGGNFTLGNVGTGTNGKPWIINCLGGNDNATVVNGGTFNSDISHQFWANEVSIPADLALKNNGNGTWTLVEAVACAEEKASSSGSTVRKVGYATLQEAIDAAGNGKTVTLLKNIELGAADVKAIPGNLTAMINVAGKSLTLDMNGKTITAAYDASELLYTVICVGDGASLTVKGDGKIDLITGDTKAGKYDCVAYMFLKSGSTGALNIENGTFTANKVEDSMVYTNSDKVVNIKGGNWTLDNVGTKTNGAPWIFNTKGQNERTILVSGGTYNFNVAKQYYAREVSIVDANGNLSYVIDNGNGTWTVTGQTAEVGIVTPTWRTNYLLGYATFKDAVASIAKGAAETTIVLQKDITVKGQFIGHSYAQKVVIDLNGYTMSSTDKALTVYRAGTEVTVKNGTVYGNTTGGTIQATYGGKLILGENVTIKSGGSATALKVDANSTLIVDQDTSYVLGGKNDLVVAEGATVQISAGYFKKPVQQAWCAEGYVPTDKLENGYYSVMEDPANGMAAVINGTYYATLQDAIAAAATGDTITVLADIAVDTSAVVANSSGYAAIYNIAEKDIIIDLNGKKIEATVNAADLESYKDGILLGVFCVDINGKLTLTGEGTVTANLVDGPEDPTASKLNSLLVAYGTGSELVVENGTFHANSVSSALVYSQYDEIITINGGTYTLGNLGKGRNGSPWLFNAKGQNTQNILVNGGTFSADIQHQYYPFEVQMVKELALSKGEDGMYTVVPAVAYVNEQEWSSKWYTNYVGYATVEEAEAAVEPIKTKVIGKNTYYSDREVVTLLVKEEVNLEDVLGGEIANVDLPAGDFTLPTTSGDVSITGTKDTVITVNDVTAKQISMSGVTVKSSGVAYTGIKHSEEVVFNDCTIVGNMYLYAENVVFTNCTFDLSETNDYIWVYGAKNVTFKDCTFNTMGKAILVFQDGSSVDQTVTVEGCTFNATQPGYNWNHTLHIAAVSMDGSQGGTYNVILNNNTVDNNFNGLWQDKTSAGNITVTVDGTTVLTKN